MLPNAAPTASRLLNQPSSGERPARESTLLAQPSGAPPKHGLTRLINDPG